MITSIKYYISEGTNPYYNLAIEQHLLEDIQEGCCILYLWQNQNTVVIGRNQNPWKECRTTELDEDGGHLARRLSGGGAVYHDLGNLNFTFLVPTLDYDLDKQLNVITEACALLGIKTERSGRNDLLADGRKFSGNAFYEQGEHSYHHGTLLVDADMSRLSKYLKPSAAKLSAKGVDSVRSRVINLKELDRELTIDEMKAAMLQAFSRVYGVPMGPVNEDQLDKARIEELYKINASWEWRYGRRLPFSFQCSDRFSWGELELQLQIESGIIKAAEVYSDAMEWDFTGELKRKLEGKRFSLASIIAAAEELSCSSQIREDIIKMLTKQEI